MSEINHLIENKESWAIDFDGTLSENIWKTDPEGIGEPIWNVIERVRQLDSQGHRIVIWSSRPSWHEARVKLWLADHQVPHQMLLVGLKFRADHYVDDKAMTPEDFVKEVENGK